MQQVHLFISGLIQGVGYREFVKSHAIRLGIKGFVKNLPDKRVEVLAQGTRTVLEELIKECNTGPAIARVDGIEITWNTTTKPFSSFGILK